MIPILRGHIRDVSRFLLINCCNCFSLFNFWIYILSYSLHLSLGIRFQSVTISCIYIYYFNEKQCVAYSLSSIPLFLCFSHCYKLWSPKIIFYEIFSPKFSLKNFSFKKISNFFLSQFSYLSPSKESTPVKEKKKRQTFSSVCPLPLALLMWKWTQKVFNLPFCSFPYFSSWSLLPMILNLIQIPFLLFTNPMQCFPFFSLPQNLFSWKFPSLNSHALFHRLQNFLSKNPMGYFFNQLSKFQNLS